MFNRERIETIEDELDAMRNALVRLQTEAAELREASEERGEAEVDERRRCVRAAIRISRRVSDDALKPITERLDAIETRLRLAEVTKP